MVVRENCNRTSGALPLRRKWFMKARGNEGRRREPFHKIRITACRTTAGKTGGRGMRRGSAFQSLHMRRLVGWWKKCFAGPFNREVRVPPAKRPNWWPCSKKKMDRLFEIRSPQNHDVDLAQVIATKTRELHAARATHRWPHLSMGERGWKKREENKPVEICSTRNVTT